MSSSPLPDDDVADWQKIAEEAERPNSTAGTLKRKRSIFDSGSRLKKKPKATGAVLEVESEIVKRVRFKKPLSEFQSAPAPRTLLLNLDDPFKFGLSTIHELRKWMGDIKVSEIAAMLVEHGSEDMPFVDALEAYVRRRDEDL